jgi:uncharacterized MAPEG superfamily protein
MGEGFMTATATCLIGLVSWTIFLIFVLLTFRIIAVVKGQKALNNFLPDGSDLDPAAQRATRAHLNSLENLPIVGALLLYALVSGQTAITDPLAMVVLGARVLQSVTHIISTSVPAVMARATLFGVQVAIWIIWAWKFCCAG